MDYKELRGQYPEVVTMEQFYRIAHISKRKAKWILENGILPCEDSRKQTRRFQIKLDDIIEFMEKLDRGEFNNVIPVGEFNNGIRGNIVYEYLDCDELNAYFLDEWCDYPDMLSVRETTKICGYDSASILRWIDKKHIKAVLYRNSYLVSKDSLSEHLSSEKGQRILKKSQLHLQYLEDFDLQQKNSDITFGVMSL